MIPTNQKAEMIQFDNIISKMLEQYGDEVKDCLQDAVSAAGDEAVRLLRKERRFSKNGKPSTGYYRGWKAITEKTNVGTKVIVANTGAHGSLTHLLEHGHPIVRNGEAVGRYEGYEHIAPVQDKMEAFVIDEIEQALGEI